MNAKTSNTQCIKRLVKEVPLKQTFGLISAYFCTYIFIFILFGLVGFTS